MTIDNHEWIVTFWAMWTIDLGVFGSCEWLRTAGRYATADSAVAAMLQLPKRNAHGAHIIYRARQLDSLDRELDAQRERATTRRVIV